MIKNRNLCILIVLFFSFQKVFSQQQTFSDYDIITNAKIFFLNQDTSFYTKSQVSNFLNDTSNYEFLSSKGFSEALVFIKIKIRGNFQAIIKEKIADSMYKKNRVPFSCDYIIACKTKAKQYYRLKGFTSNDFIHFFAMLHTKKNRASFLNQFWVDELDLPCLFDSFFIEKKSSVAAGCLLSCKDRDKAFLHITNH